MVPDTAQFEATLNFMLANRAETQRKNLELDPTKPLGIKLDFLALAFAVLASGSQCTSLRGKERELTSQVYGMLYLPPRAIR